MRLRDRIKKLRPKEIIKRRRERRGAPARKQDPGGTAGGEETVTRPGVVTRMKSRVLLTGIKHGLSFGGAAIAGWGINLSRAGHDAHTFWMLAAGVLAAIAGHWLSWKDKDKKVGKKSRMYGQVRHTLQDLAGFTVTVGWLPFEMANTILGIVGALIAASWSIKDPQKFAIASKVLLLAALPALLMLGGCSIFDRGDKEGAQPDLLADEKELVIRSAIDLIRRELGDDGAKAVIGDVIEMEETEVVPLPPAVEDPPDIVLPPVGETFGGEGG